MGDYISWCSIKREVIMVLKVIIILCIVVFLMLDCLLWRLFQTWLEKLETRIESLEKASWLR